MKTAISLFLIASCLVLAQEFTGKARFNGNMQINVVDNCTVFLCGNSNVVTGLDKNFKQWIACRMDGVAGRSCRVSMVLAKTGTPIGNIKIAIFANNAGQPGTKLFETGALDASEIVSGATNKFPGIAWDIPAQNLWLGVYTSDPVSLFAVDNYISYANHYSGVVTDKVFVSDDGTSWADGGSLTFFSIRFLRAE